MARVSQARTYKFPNKLNYYLFRRRGHDLEKARASVRELKIEKARKFARNFTAAEKSDFSNLLELSQDSAGIFGVISENQKGKPRLRNLHTLVPFSLEGGDSRTLVASFRSSAEELNLNFIGMDLVSLAHAAQVSSRKGGIIFEEEKPLVFKVGRIFTESEGEEAYAKKDLFELAKALKIFEIDPAIILAYSRVNYFGLLNWSFLGLELQPEFLNAIVERFSSHEG